MGTNFATIENCSIRDCYVEGNADSVGGISGYSGGTVEKCFITKTRVFGASYLGGIVGSSGGTIRECYNAGYSIQSKGGSNVGGIAGNNTNTVDKCYNRAYIKGGYWTTGGIVGWNNGNTSKVSDSYNAGTVTGKENLGPVVGEIGSSCSNCHYLEGTCTDPTNASGYEWSEPKMKSEDMISALGGNSYWKQDSFINEGFPILVNNLQDRGIYDTTQQNSSNYFTVQNNTLVPNNYGKASVTAYNYMKIDLTDVDSSATFTLTVNASVNSEKDLDYGFATILKGYSSSIPNPPEYNISTGQFMKISGTTTEVKTDTNYSTVINGGTCYYLYLGYRKDGGGNADSERFTVNSITIVSGGSLPVNGVNIPRGYKPTGKTDEDTVAEGLVIKDNSENEYVWIEVPKTAAVYSTAGLNITSFTDTEYSKIENDLKSYSNYYNSKGVTSGGDVYYSGCGFSSATDYNNAKKKMLKSVYQNGGFWIGRYEAGISSNVPRTSHTPVTSSSTKAVSRVDMKPYNYVCCSEAQLLASQMSANSSVTSSLMFGVQWNLVCKFLENKATSSLGATGSARQLAINNNSKDWGNYSDSNFTLNRGQYSTNNGSSWTPSSNTTKNSNNTFLLTTGASDHNKVLNIYDFAGNVCEWTLEKTNSNSNPCSIRGGYYNSVGTGSPASYRSDGGSTDGYVTDSFRVALY